MSVVVVVSKTDEPKETLNMEMPQEALKEQEIHENKPEAETEKRSPRKQETEEQTLVSSFPKPMD